jgi:hypothetical protein
VFGQGRKKQLAVHPAIGREETPCLWVLLQDRFELSQFGWSNTVRAERID